MKQNIEGDNNIQISKVQGSVVIDKRRPHFLPNDPNVVDCPYHCGQQTWFNSDKCWNCDRPVGQYFLELARQKQREEFKNNTFRIGVTAIGLSAGIYIISPYLPENISVFTSLLSFPFLMFGIVSIGQSMRA